MDMEKLFPVKRQCLYFNFASDGPLPQTACKAVKEAVEERMNSGTVAVDKQISLFENIRTELAALFNADRENFAFVKNTSEGVLLSLLAMDIKEDENYLVAEDAFPTTVKIMGNHCKGQMRKVKINTPTNICRQVLTTIDHKTRAVVLDWVHYFSGKVIDLTALAEIARQRDIFTVIDGIQGAGALSLDLAQSSLDFFVSGGHKWLLSPQGTGFIYVSPKVWERIERKSFGWLGYDWKDFSDFDINPELRPGAAVMEYGTRSYLAGIGFLESLKIINKKGIKNIEKHNQELREFFKQNISKRGFETIDNHGSRSASIVPFKFPGLDSRTLKERLDKENVKVALRNNCIRAAFHFINDKQEVQKFLDFL